jgi:hypothetical protein
VVILNFCLDHVKNKKDLFNFSMDSEKQTIQKDLKDPRNSKVQLEFSPGTSLLERKLQKLRLEMKEVKIGTDVINQGPCCSKEAALEKIQQSKNVKSGVHSEFNDKLEELLSICKVMNKHISDERDNSTRSSSSNLNERPISTGSFINSRLGSRISQSRKKSLRMRDDRQRGKETVDMGLQTNSSTLVVEEGKSTMTSNNVSDTSINQGDFKRAMSRISQNQSSAEKVTSNSGLCKEIFEELQLALAVKMGINCSKLVKQRALNNVLSCKYARNDIQQVLQARAHIYGDSLDINFFTQNADLGGKTRTTQSRNQARAMLVGAPLLVAQIEALELRKRLMQGESGALNDLDLNSKMTFAEFLEKLRSLPPLEVFRLYDRRLEEFVTENLLKHSDDLDFMQDILYATANHSTLNPTLHSVIAGFDRRRNKGRFKHGGKSLEFDRLRFSWTISDLDNDLKVKEFITGGSEVGKSFASYMSQKSKKTCFFYQKRSGCRMSHEECPFVHKCEKCGGDSHGASECRLRKGVLVSRSIRKNAPTSRRKRQVVFESSNRRSKRKRVKDNKR